MYITLNELLQLLSFVVEVVCAIFLALGYIKSNKKQLP